MSKRRERDETGGSQFFFSYTSPFPPPYGLTPLGLHPPWDVSLVAEEKEKEREREDCRGGNEETEMARRESLEVKIT